MIEQVPIHELEDRGGSVEHTETAGTLGYAGQHSVLLVLIGLSYHACFNRRHMSAYERLTVFVHHATSVSFVKISGLNIHVWPDEVLKLCTCNIVPM